MKKSNPDMYSHHYAYASAWSVVSSVPFTKHQPVYHNLDKNDENKGTHLPVHSFVHNLVVLK
jgi:hypothetical protein